MTKIVSREEWLIQRKALLRDEKALTRLKDGLAERRRMMPWVQIDKEYRFDTNDGEKTLADLFDGRSQLIVYHFMFGPDWTEGCLGCTEVADNFNGTIWHLNTRDASFVAISRSSLDKLNGYKARMDWTFEWISSLRSDFNFDFDVSFQNPENSPKTVNFAEVEAELEETHGVSIFVKAEDGTIYHTYSCYERGVEILCCNMQYLDLLPNGRQDSLFWSNPTRRN